MKKCFKCGLEKPLTEFYKHPKTKDGYLNKCKDCAKSDVHNDYSKNRNNPEFMEKERKRNRDRGRLSPRGKINCVLHLEECKRYQTKFPEKNEAKLKSSSLTPPEKGFERHHWSYNKEHYKDVIWLTKKNHMKGHRFIIYDQERKMYRRFDTNELLDIKENHENFIRWCIENKEN